MKFVAVLLALAAVVAALVYPFPWSKHRQTIPALAHPEIPAQAGACPAPIYQRVRNISSLDFYDLRVDGIDFGPLPAGAETEYRQTTGCVFGVANVTLTSSQGPTATVPYDLIGEKPMEAGYYTRALSLAPNNAVTSQLTRDTAPN